LTKQTKEETRRGWVFLRRHICYVLHSYAWDDSPTYLYIYTHDRKKSTKSRFWS